MCLCVHVCICVLCAYVVVLLIFLFQNLVTSPSCCWSIPTWFLMSFFSMCSTFPFENIIYYFLWSLAPCLKSDCPNSAPSSRLSRFICAGHSLKYLNFRILSAILVWLSSALPLFEFNGQRRISAESFLHIKHLFQSISEAFFSRISPPGDENCCLGFIFDSTYLMLSLNKKT